MNCHGATKAVFQNLCITPSQAAQPKNVNADGILNQMSTKSLFAKNDFFCCGVHGEVLAATDLTDSEGLRDMIDAIKRADGEEMNYDILMRTVLVPLEFQKIDDEAEAIKNLLSGDALVFLDGEEGCVSVNMRKYEIRTITEPPTSGVTQGPREGFIENIKTNMSLIERKLRTPKLKIERMKIGRHTSTEVAVVSIEGIADEKIVESVIRKLKKIDIDGVLDSHYLQNYVEPRPYSIFNQVGTCEKPDICAAKLLEGRVAILCDGSPIVLTLPFMFLEEVQSAEDYYQRAPFASFLRIVRIIATLFGIFLPGFYVALEIFHFSIMPEQLLQTIINATKGVPLPPLAEVLFVILLFEIIREAGIRMPQSMGLAMSVVGALVLGETAVNAGMIGSPAVMIVALSSISTYTVPDAADSSAIMRLVFTLIGGFLGLYGLLIGAVFLLIYLVALNGYRTPFLAPYAPNIASDKKDGLIKEPLLDLDMRPESIPQINKRRRKK